ncbi:Mut7-C RNAse domain-containing protein [archaeon]|nr:Mut7-C RNAse domain-containing protein [archaeon]
MRIFGYDAELASGDECDEKILKRARLEGRVLLTRDKKLGENDGVVLLESSDDAEQMHFLVKTFGLKLSECPRPLCCSLCNGTLRDAGQSELPEHVEQGWACVDCNQLYWHGSHWNGIKKFLEKVRCLDSSDAF